MRGFFSPANIRFVLLISGLMLAVSSCLPIPQLKLELDLPEPIVFYPDAAMKTSYLSIEGFAEPNTPQHYNRAYYQRYFSQGNKPDTIVVLMPGIYGGASSLDLLARQLVATNRNLEVWAIDRRANALEDRSAMKKSLMLADPYIAFDYYIKNYGTAQGFTPIPPEDLRFVGFWGLELHLRDLHEVILLANEQAPRVILGGHSLGAAIVGFYAAFDFGVASSDPGYRYIDGLVLIDGALGRTGAFGRKPEGLGLGPLELIAGTESLEAGRGSPYLTFAASPQVFARRDVLGLLASLRPEELAPEGLYPFPLTNLAALGLSEDDQYSSSTVFSSSWGQALGAKTAGNITAVILGGSEGFRSQTVIGVAEGFDYVDWEAGDASRERSSIAEVASLSAQLATNSNEWYFPLRLAFDIGEKNLRLENEKGFVANSEVKTPTLAIGAGRGLMTSVDKFSAYQNARPGSAFSTYVLPGLTHFDIVQTLKSPVVSLFNLWLEQLK